MRGQLEHLLEVGELRNVEIQVMPTDREDHAGLARSAPAAGAQGREDGGTLGGQLFNRP